MKKRLGIFCFYDKFGTVDRYVLFLLKELLTVVKDLIIVVNGRIRPEDEKLLLKLCKKLIKRNNTGYDGGAYRDVLINYIGKEELQNYSELLLCNDSCYGPFVPLSTVFEQMEVKNCDFWGMNSLGAGVFKHVDAYFLVFRESLLQNGLLYEYFFKNINQDTQDLTEIITTFEYGLTKYLTTKGYKESIYINDNRLNMYECSGLLIADYGFPLLKKKCFDTSFNTRIELMDSVLYYIKYCTNYDIELILENVKRLYHYEMNDFRTYQKEYKCSTCSQEDLNAFIKKATNIYIYGAGGIGRRIYLLYLKGNPKFRGFIVSDGQSQEPLLYDSTVYKISDIRSNTEVSIIVAMNETNSKQVRMSLANVKSVFYLWD